MKKKKRWLNFAENLKGAEYGGRVHVLSGGYVNAIYRQLNNDFTS